jgi:hypothetical protein
MHEKLSHSLIGLILVGLTGCAAGGGDAVGDAGATRRDGGADSAITLADFGASLGDAAPAGDAGPGTDAVVSATDAIVSATDAGPTTACANGLDDDADGSTDFPDDPGCSAADDDDEADPPAVGQCENGLDDDDDGNVDAADTDCTSSADPTEQGGASGAECGNGLDDDADGVVDFPDDPGCRAAGDAEELDPVPAPACDNTEDDDADGHTDYPTDPGCAGRGDADEADPVVAPACSNGLDDDASGQADYPADPGCDSAGDPMEVGPCGADVEVIDLNGALAGADAVLGDLTGAPAHAVGTCGGAAGGERVYAWRSVGRVDRVRFSTRHPETLAPTVLYARAICGAPADLTCNRGGGVPGTDITLEAPAPGLYYIFVDTGSPDQVGAFRLSVDEVRAPACRNAEDDDGDGDVDLADEGCVEGDDTDETDPPTHPACHNGVDDDGDGMTDYPADPDCVAAGAEREAPLCAIASPIVAVGQAGGTFDLPLQDGNGAAGPSCDVAFGPETVLVLTLDELSTVRVEVTVAGAPSPGAIYARTDCADAGSEFGCVPANRPGGLTLSNLAAGVYFVVVEQGFPAPAEGASATITVESLVRECNDAIDNDADGVIDLLDPGCEEGRDDDEGNDPPAPPACANGADDDGDGLVDYPDDDGCQAAGDTDELARDRHMSEDFNPDGVGQIWCNAEGDINFHDYGLMTFPECDALANRTGTQYYAGTQWQGQPGEGWLGDHDGATATASSPGGDWSVTQILPADMPYTCRLALMPHRREPDPNQIGPETLYDDGNGHRWHYWLLTQQSASQCLAYADTVRGRIINPWSVGLGPRVMMTSPTHWCHAGPQFNQDNVGINSDQPGDCAVGFWE